MRARCSDCKIHSLGIICKQGGDTLDEQTEEVFCGII